MEISDTLWEKALQLEEHYARKYSYHLSLDKEAYIAEAQTAIKAIEQLKKSNAVRNPEPWLNKTIKFLSIQFNRERIEQLAQSEDTPPEYEISGDVGYEEMIDQQEENDAAIAKLTQRCMDFGVEYRDGMTAIDIARSIAEKHPEKQLDMKIIEIINGGTITFENIKTTLPKELIKGIKNSDLRIRVSKILEENFGIVKNPLTIADAVRRLFKKQPNITSAEFQTNPIMRENISNVQLRADYYKKYRKKMRDGDF